MFFILFTGKIYRLKIYTRFPMTFLQSRRHHEVIIFIIEALDTLLENFYSTEVSETQNQPEISKLIPCPHCLATQTSREATEIYHFEHVRCVKAVTSGETEMKCGKSDVKIPLSLMAPDIALAGIRVIKEQHLVIDKEIGKGGKRITKFFI